MPKKKKPKAKKKVLKKTVWVRPKRKKKKFVSEIPDRMYRVEQEVRETNRRTGETSYRYIPYRVREVEEETARGDVRYMKQFFIGGRLIYLDGSPNGVVEETWASAARLLEAEAIEKKLLETQTSNR